MIKIKTESNYLAKIFRIKNIRKHGNADRLQCVSVDFNNVITDLKAKDGDPYIFFPVGSAIDPELLSHLNCYEDSSLNEDPKVTGYFSSKGVVKAANLRSEKSEGLILPLREIESFYDCSGLEKYDGQYLDSIKENLICWKYENPNPTRTQSTGNKKTRAALKKTSKIVPQQFHLHEDTEQLGRNVHKLNLDDEISVTYKLHGTSVVLGRVRVKRDLSLFERVCKFFGLNIQEEAYPDSDVLPLYSSRKVIKNKDYVTGQSNSYYSFDVYTEIARRYGSQIPKNITVYGEIVGQLPSGAWVQKMKGKGFDYGLDPNSIELFVYRVTFVTHDGTVYELGTPLSKQFCDKYGFKFVPIFFEGTVRQFLVQNNKEISENGWPETFVNLIKDLYNEKDCYRCKNKLPEEGVVVVKQRLDKFEAYKQKSHRFLKAEVDELENSEEEQMD